MRLDRILLRKAEQGVKVLVMIYKEVTQSMSLSSAHTKHHLEDMHKNSGSIWCIPGAFGGAELSGSSISPHRLQARSSSSTPSATDLLPLSQSPVSGIPTTSEAK